MHNINIRKYGYRTDKKIYVTSQNYILDTLGNEVPEFNPILTEWVMVELEKLLLTSVYRQLSNEELKRIKDIVDKEYDSRGL